MYYHAGLVADHDPSLDEWEEFGFESKQAFVEHLLERRINSPLPEVKNFKKREVIKGYCADGTKGDTVFEVTYSGKPKYWFIQGHEMDSYWEYPEIGRLFIGGLHPNNLVSHAEYTKRRRRK